MARVAPVLAVGEHEGGSGVAAFPTAFGFDGALGVLGFAPSLVAGFDRPLGVCEPALPLLGAYDVAFEAAELWRYSGPGLGRQKSGRLGWRVLLRGALGWPLTRCSCPWIFARGCCRAIARLGYAPGIG